LQNLLLLSCLRGVNTKYFHFHAVSTLILQLQLSEDTHS
jgi:hypothetical protein